MVPHEPPLEAKTAEDLPEVEESQLIGILVRSDHAEDVSENIGSIIRRSYRMKSRSMLFFKYFLVRYLR